MKRLKSTDALSAEAFLEAHPPAHLSIRVLYKCSRCGNRVEMSIPTSAVLCTRCGTRMRPAHA